MAERRQALIVTSLIAIGCLAAAVMIVDVGVIVSRLPKIPNYGRQLR